MKNADGVMTKKNRSESRIRVFTQLRTSPIRIQSQWTPLNAEGATKANKKRGSDTIQGQRGQDLCFKRGAKIPKSPRKMLPRTNPNFLNSFLPINPSQTFPHPNEHGSREVVPCWPRDNSPP